MNRESAESPLDDRHVVKGVIIKFYFVEVTYYVSPCYEVESFEAVGCRCIRVCEQ